MMNDDIINIPLPWKFFFQSNVESPSTTVHFFFNYAKRQFHLIISNKYDKAALKLLLVEARLAISKILQARFNVLHQKAFEEYDERL